MCGATPAAEVAPPWTLLVGTGRTDLPADLAAREITGTGIDAIHTVIGVHVHVRPTRAQRRDQVRHRMPRERPDEVRGGDAARGEHAVGAAAAPRPQAQEEHDDGPLHTPG